jgi:hypothetical protein
MLPLASYDRRCLVCDRSFEPGVTTCQNRLCNDPRRFFATGGTLNEVARKPWVDGGAVEVCGLTLARQPWQGH